MRYNCVKKLLIIICFFTISISRSNLFAQDIPASSSDFNVFMISESYGTIRDSYFSPQSKGVIIHIQDLHCNYDAQISISNIIKELIDKYNLKLVTMEGNTNELDTAPYDIYVDERNKEEVGKYYLMIGEFNGPTYAHLITEGKFALWGVDDEELYNNNLKAYKNAKLAEEYTSSYYKNLDEIFEKLKEKVFSNELMELDAKIKAYKNEKLRFSEYVEYLDKLLDKYGLSDEKYQNFVVLKSLLIKEGQIDFLEVDTERAEYIDGLYSALEQADLTELINKSLYFKTGKITALNYYSYIEEISKVRHPEKRSDEGSQPVLTDYPQLQKYIEYVKLYSGIDNIKLFDEIENIEISLKEKFFRNKDERKLDSFSRNVEVLKGLFNLKLTKEDIGYFREHKAEIRTAYVVNFVSDFAKQYNVSFKLDPAFRKIDAALTDLEQFYSLAEERDTVMVNKTVEKMRNNNLNIAVLVAGGFHTEGLKTVIKEKGYSYVVITPKVDNLEGTEELYNSSISKEPNELDILYDFLVKNRKEYYEKQKGAKQ